MNISKTHTRAAILAAATVATSATGAIVPDSDTVLYVSCDTDYKFGENLATAEGKLTNVHRKNDRLQTSGAAGAFVHDGSTGNGSANGGYFYSEGGPAATWSPNDYHKSDFTFEVFVRLDSDASLQYVANHNNAWRLQYNSANRLFLRDGSGTYIAGDNTDATLLRDGAWHHVAVVQNRTAGTMSFYVDYKLVGSKAYMVTDPAADSNYLVIGAYSRNGEYNYNNQTTKCAYDELRITKRALTPREFLFQRVCPVDGDTIAYMSFDAGTNPTNAAYDITLDSSALDVGRKSWGTPSYAVQNSVAAQTLHSGAFDSEGFTNSGALAVSISGGSNAGSGHGYHFTDTGRLTGTASFTAELFAQFTDNPSPYYGYVFFQTGIWNCFLETSGKIGCSVAGETRRSSINLVDGKWHHLAAVYDSCAAAFSFYIDHALLERFANVSFDGISHPGALLFGGNNDSNGGMIGGVNGALYDELRITKRALKPTEFITTESIAGRDPIFFARYDSDFEGMAAGRYAVTGEVSAAGAELAASAKASREILNSSKEVLFANAKGLDLLGGTVAYPGNGVFDLNAATAEFFVRKLGGGAADNVVAFGASGAANPVWSLSASGAFVFRTASDNLAASLAIGDGQFHHVAVAYAPSGANTAVTVYLDHTAVASGTLTGGIDFGSGAGFTVGSAGFTGAIDELRLRESARGVAEMLHASPPPATFMVFR